MKRSRLIISILTIVLCVSLITGASYAIFTSESKVDIAVGTGKVDVKATIDEASLKLYSMDQLVVDSFTNGGTASIQGNELNIDKITPGDKVEFDILVKNYSTAIIKSRTHALCTLGGPLFNALDIKIDAASIQDFNDNPDNAWAIVAPDADPNNPTAKTIKVSVELPESATAETQGQRASIAFVVNAVQGNTDMEIVAGKTLDYNPVNVNGFNYLPAGMLVTKAVDAEQYTVHDTKTYFDGLVVERTLTLKEDVIIAPSYGVINGNSEIVSQYLLNDIDTVDLNGKNISFAYDSTNVASEDIAAIFGVESGSVIFKDSVGGGSINADSGKTFSSVESEKLASKISYAIAVGGTGSVTIQSGQYIGSPSAVMVTSGEANIAGGHFEASKSVNETDKGAANMLIDADDDAWTAGTANISITNGEFVNFDPAGEHEITVNSALNRQSYLSNSGYKVSNVADGAGNTTYNVELGKLSQQALDQVAEGGELTLDSSAKLVNNGTPITMSNNPVIDLNGNDLIIEDDIDVPVGANLTINDATGKGNIVNNSGKTINVNGGIVNVNGGNYNRDAFNVTDGDLNINGGKYLEDNVINIDGGASQVAMASEATVKVTISSGEFGMRSISGASRDNLTIIGGIFAGNPLEDDVLKLCINTEEYEVIVYLGAFKVQIIAPTSHTEGLAFALNADSESYAVAGYTGNYAKVRLPKEYKGKSVTSIKNIDSDVVSELWIPDTITTVEDGAFGECPLLTKLVLPASVVNMTGAAFGCINLESIEFRGVSNKYTIETGSLMETATHTLIKALDATTIPSSVTAYSKNALRGLNIAGYTIPANVTNIGEGAFEGTTGATNIVIPSNVVDMGANVFSNSSIARIYIEEVAKPDGWNANWNASNIDTIWGYDGASHTYTFDAKSGEAVGDITSSDVITLPTTTRTGYTLSGWQLVVGGEVLEAGSTYYSAINCAFNAVWTANTYTITFDGNGADVSSSMDVMSVDAGKTITLPDNTFTRGEATFLGWSTTRGGEVTYADGASFTMSTTNVTLYAKWKLLEYDITYELNGGINSPNNKAKFTVEDIGFVFEPATQDNKVFGGWYDNAEFNGEAVHNITSCNAMTLYAYFETATMGLTYELRGEEYAVIGDTSYVAEMVVPSRYNGYPVTTIAQDGLGGYIQLKSVKLPEGITTIESKGLYNLYNMTDVYLPSTLKTIGANAFGIDVDNSYSNQYKMHYAGDISTWLNIKFANEWANPMTAVQFTYFQDVLIDSAVIPEGVEAINNYAFYYSQISTFELPHSLKSIGDYAFKRSNVESIVLKENVASIGVDAFGRNVKVYSMQSEEALKVPVDNVIYDYDTINPHTYTFNTGCDVVVEPISQAGEITLPSASRNGYTLLGWTLEGSETLLGTNYYSPMNVTLYAKWSATTQTLYFDGNHADVVGTMNAIKLKTDETHALPANQFKRRGYSFSGWALTTDGLVQYVDASEFVMSSTDVTLYAVWAPLEKHSITYHMNGGTNNRDNKTEFTSEDLGFVLKTATATVKNKLFGGWYDNAEFNGKAIHTISEVKNYELYAKWVDGTTGLAFTWNGSGEGTPARVVSYNGNDTIVNIPTVYNGYEVTSIQYNAFKNKANITEVNMPDTITSIGTSAFEECRNLATVKLSSRLETISQRAFFNCYAYKIKRIPASVKFIESDAFSGIHSQNAKVYYEGTANDWAKIVFSNAQSNPNGFYGEFYIGDVLQNGKVTLTEDSALTNINAYAFGYTKITEIVIPEGVTSIEESAFEDCEFLKAITLPSTLKKINATAFNSTKINRINVTGDLAMWCSVDKGQIFAANQYTMTINGENVLNGVIPDSVTFIRAYAFANCVSFDTMFMPSTVDMVYDNAFNGTTFTIRTDALANKWGSTWNANGNKVVYGFDNKPHTYVFHTNSDDVLQNITGSEPIKLPTPNKEHYDFVGWYDNAETNGIAYTSTYYSTTSNELYAKWQLHEYKITYKDMGYYYSHSNPTKYTIETPTIDLKDATRVGYKFLGWHDVDGLDVTTIITSTPSNIVLTPQWELVTYTITYELNDGYNNPGNPATFTVNDLDAQGRITLLSPDNKPAEIVAEGGPVVDSNGRCVQKFNVKAQTFLGWYSDVDLITRIESISSCKNITVYANWDNKNGVEEKLLYQRVDESNTPSATGNYLLFGEYPTKMVSNVPNYDHKGADGYYYDTDGNRYVLENLRNFYGKYENGTQIDINNDKREYYKVEPIKWRILTEHYIDATGQDKGALIMSDKVIDQQPFNATAMDNNYAKSSIRAWLNNEFYAKAFNEYNSSLIVTTLVDNSKRSAAGTSNNPYYCANTEDKVFLMSSKETTTVEYGFSAKLDTENCKARQIKITDYALGMGVEQQNYNGIWWMRTPYYGNATKGLYVDVYGYMKVVGGGNESNVDSNTIGVVPALTIKL